MIDIPYAYTKESSNDNFPFLPTQLGTLLHCCCKRKRFLSTLVAKQLGACLLLSLRDCEAAQLALCLALEWELIAEPDQRLTVATTLQSTPAGSRSYQALCERQLHLQELVSPSLHVIYDMFLRQLNMRIDSF